MSEMPTVSVIIKTYNEEEGIAKTIHSIRDNLHAYPHEILVADSLSSDNTQKIALGLGRWWCRWSMERSAVVESGTSLVICTRRGVSAAVGW